MDLRIATALFLFLSLCVYINAETDDMETRADDLVIPISRQIIDRILKDDDNQEISKIYAVEYSYPKDTNSDDLYLHASAYDGHEHNYAKVRKHSEAFNKKQSLHHHRTPTRNISKGKVPAKLKNSKTYKKSDTVNKNKKTIFEQTINSKEIRIVNSAEINNLGNEPTLVNRKNYKNKSYISTNKKNKINGYSANSRKEKSLRKKVYSEKDNMKSKEDNRKYTNIDKIATMKNNDNNNMSEIVKSGELSDQIEEPTVTSKKNTKNRKFKDTNKMHLSNSLRKKVYSEKDNMKSNEDSRKYTNIDNVNSGDLSGEVEEPTITNKKNDESRKYKNINRIYHHNWMKSDNLDQEDIKNNEDTKKYTNIDKIYGRVKATMRNNDTNNMRETVNSVELSGQVEEPTIINKKNDENRKYKNINRMYHYNFLLPDNSNQRAIKNNEDTRKYTNNDKMYGRAKATMRNNANNNIREIVNSGELNGREEEPTITNKQNDENRKYKNINKMYHYTWMKSDNSDQEDIKNNEDTRKYTNIDKMYGRLKATMRSNDNYNMHETVNSSELSSQIEEPIILNNENSITKEYALKLNKKSLDDSNKIIKELIFPKGFKDFMELLEIIGLDIPEISHNETDCTIITDSVPLESKKTEIDFRNQYGTSTFHEDSKELLHDESTQTKNVFQRRQEKATSGEEIQNKRVIKKVNKIFDSQHKLLGEEIDTEYIYEDTKPKLSKSIFIVKNEDPSARVIEEIDEYDNKDFEKIIESSEIEEGDVPVTGINRNYVKPEEHEVTENPYPNTRRQFNEELIDEDLKNNRNYVKHEEFEVTETPYPVTRKQFNEELIDKDLKEIVNSNENIEVVEHIHKSNIKSEPESFEQYIFIVNKNPSHSQQKYVKEKIAKSNGLYQNSEEIIENTKKIQQKNPKNC